MANNCPEDCLRIIFGHLRVGTARHNHDVADILACIKVCRRWHNVAQERLYEHIQTAVPKNERPRVKQCLALLRRTPRLARMVKTLQTDTGKWYRPKHEQLLALLPNLTHYILEYHTIESIGANFLPTHLNPRLRSLTLTPYPYGSRTVYLSADAFVRLPASLETLTASGVDLTTVSTALPTLQHFKIHQGVQISQTLLLNCPSLHSVTLANRSPGLASLVLTALGLRLTSLHLRGARYAGMVIGHFPPSLENITWSGMVPYDIRDMFLMLSRTEFLPKFRRCGALYTSLRNAVETGYWKWNTLQVSMIP